MLWVGHCRWPSVFYVEIKGCEAAYWWKPSGTCQRWRHSEPELEAGNQTWMGKLVFYLLFICYYFIFHICGCLYLLVRWPRVIARDVWYTVVNCSFREQHSINIACTELCHLWEIVSLCDSKLDVGFRCRWYGQLFLMTAELLVIPTNLVGSIKSTENNGMVPLFYDMIWSDKWFALKCCQASHQFNLSE